MILRLIDLYSEKKLKVFQKMKGSQINMVMNTMMKMTTMTMRIISARPYLGSAMERCKAPSITIFKIITNISFAYRSLPTMAMWRVQCRGYRKG